MINAMTEPESTEYKNFKNLLGRIVSVPNAEIKKRLKDEQTKRDWIESDHQPKPRHRPIVSPGSVASPKRAT
jgi:hypothetical protein